MYAVNKQQRAVATSLCVAAAYSADIAAWRENGVAASVIIGVMAVAGVMWRNDGVEIPGMKEQHVRGIAKWHRASAISVA